MATSGQGVSNIPNADVVSSQVSGAINQIAGISAENTAKSAEFAREQRNWQEQQNKLAMEFNAAEAAKNRDWQALQSNTAHQRQIADLKAAGLNPVLSAMGGQGAATGSGATASGVTSSGAKGDVDTSQNTAITHILSAWLNATNELQMQQNNARSQEAIAEKYTAMSELVAHLSGQYNLSNTAAIGANALNQISQQGSNARALQQQTHENQMEYTRQYPSNAYQAGSALVGGLGNTIDAITNIVSGANRIPSKIEKAIEKTGIKMPDVLPSRLKKPVALPKSKK